MKVKVNISLLEAIKQILKHAKFLKKLCTNKMWLKDNEKIKLGRNVSTLIQPMPQKREDRGTFTIPHILGNCRFERVIIDFGASINVMLLSIFKSLGLGPLRPIGIVIQLANKSSTYLASVIKDVLFRVKEFIFPNDFYMLKMRLSHHTMLETLFLN